MESSEATIMLSHSTMRQYQAASVFDKCPADILYMVFKSLSTTELHKLCVVNKLFRAIAEPFLYSKIHWTWGEPLSPHPITQLLRTLLCRPQLAAYITGIHLDRITSKHNSIYPTFRKSSTPTAELYSAIAFIRETRVPYSDLWIQELHLATMDAFVALLLAQVPNLRYLSLGPNVARPDRIIGMVLRSAICEPMKYKLPSFEHLQDVFFLLNLSQIYVREKMSKDIAALSLFYLPNVQHMSASIENPTAFSWPKACLPTLSKLTSLDLTKIREVYLGELLSVTPNLQSLHWKWQYDHGLDNDFNQPIVDLDRIAAAISHVKGTLTELTITACCEIQGDDQWIPSIEIEGSLNAMVNWAMLKKLHIPWVFLMGFERDKSKRLQHVMPKNIEFLSITDDLKLQDNDSTQPEWPLWIWNEYKILKKLRLWLEDREACTPHLRRITLIVRTEWIFDEFDEWSPDIRQAYRDLSARTGVEIEIMDLDTK